MVFGLRPYGAVSWRHWPECCYGGGAAGVGLAGSRKTRVSGTTALTPAQEKCGTRSAECEAALVAQEFVPAGSRDFRVPCFPAFWELELATGKSPLPADKNVGATRANGLGKVLFARMVFGLRPYGAVSWRHWPERGRFLI